MDKYKQELENIKEYLTNEGVKVDTVTMWQGGFRHEGSYLGLEIIARIEVDGKEEIYYVPNYLVRQGKEIKKYMKKYNRK